MKMPRRFLVAAVPVLLVLGACGDSDDTSSSDTTASTTDDVVQLTFTGSECVNESPDEVTAGVVTIDFVNDSNGIAGVFVGVLDDGKTVQNAIDEWGLDEPALGGRPLWITDTGGRPPAQAGETVRWETSLAAGQHIALCTARPANTVWFGGGFTVVDG